MNVYAGLLGRLPFDSRGPRKGLGSAGPSQGKGKVVVAETSPLELNGGHLQLSRRPLSKASRWG
eukprot:10646494-Alexandrium_andersonii.AAC.1